ncbi:MAG: hypothetical protein ACOYD6_01490 [Limnochordia bacterium]
MERLHTLWAEPRGQLYAGILGSLSILLLSSFDGLWIQGAGPLAVIAGGVGFSILVRQILFPPFRDVGYFKTLFFFLLITAGFIFGLRGGHRFPPLTIIGYCLYALVISYLLAGVGEAVLAVGRYLHERQLPTDFLTLQVRQIRDETYGLAQKLSLVILIPLCWGLIYLWWRGGGAGGLYLGVGGAILLWASFFLPVHHIQQAISRWGKGWYLRIEEEIQAEFLQGLTGSSAVGPAYTRLEFLLLVRQELEELLCPSIPPNLLWSVIFMGLIPLALASLGG